MARRGAGSEGLEMAGIGGHRGAGEGELFPGWCLRTGTRLRRGREVSVLLRKDVGLEHAEWQSSRITGSGAK